jgi:hypothetical protein
VIPQFGSCLVCEIIRPEQNGKLIILGFFGVCPNVDIILVQIDQPSVLTFLFNGGPGEGQYEASFDIVDQTGRILIASAAPMPFTAQPNSPTSLSTTLFSTFGFPGIYAIRCLINGVEHFRGYFRVGQAQVPHSAV